MLINQHMTVDELVSLGWSLYVSHQIVSFFHWYSSTRKRRAVAVEKRSHMISHYFMNGNEYAEYKITDENGIERQWTEIIENDEFGLYSLL